MTWKNIHIEQPSFGQWCFVQRIYNEKPTVSLACYVGDKKFKLDGAEVETIGVWQAITFPEI